jgi:hypothetical protein
MNGVNWLVVIVLLALPINVFAHSKACQTLDQIDWMLGSWVDQDKGSTTSEVWQKASNLTYEGVGTSVSQGKQFTETLRIVSMSEQIFFIAKVPGNPLPVAFAGQNCAHNSIKFVNPKHDFPTTIEYQLITTNQLQAKVSGADGKGFSLLFTRKNLPQ